MTCHNLFQCLSYRYIYDPCPQVGCVTVLVPPDIDQELSSGDVTVTEVRLVIRD